MKIIKSKGLAQKIITVVIFIILLFNFIFPVKSQAIDLGGVLWNPIKDLLCNITDTLFNVLQHTFIANAPEAVVKLTNAEIEEGKSYGIISGRIAALLSSENLDYFRKQNVFPNIFFSVENIFANKIPAFDVDFISHPVKNPKVEDKSKNVSIKKDLNNILTTDEANLYYSNQDMISEDYKKNYWAMKEIACSIVEDGTGENLAKWYEKAKTYRDMSDPKEKWAYGVLIQLKEFPIKEDTVYMNDFENQEIENNVTFKKLQEQSIITSEGQVNMLWEQKYKAGEEAGIDVQQAYQETISEAKGWFWGSIGNIAEELSGTISNWYLALRNIAIVAMLSILVYIAIRIIISSTSEEAKYKVMLKDWLIGICLLFIMHYIMAFSLNMTNSLTGMLNNIYQNNLNEYANSVNNSNEGSLENDNVDNSVDTIASMMRTSIAATDDVGYQMGYTILYVLLLMYTIMFTWQYLKRVIYMAFLTIISPLVAMTYPIDKINDGKSQGFNMWLKEYIFNLLLQPLHLLLFTILAGSAMNLFYTNIVYSLIALGFLLQAEKILKKLFGFDSKPPIGGGGLAGGFAGGAIFSTALNAIRKVPEVGKGKSSKETDKIRTADNNKFNLPSTDDVGSSYGNLSTFKTTNKEGNDLQEHPERGETKDEKPKMEPLNSDDLFRELEDDNKPKTEPLNSDDLFKELEDDNPVDINKKKTNENDVQQTQNYKPKRKIIKGMKNLAKRYVPTVAKVGAGYLAAGTLGIAGIAGGLASDDYSNVFKFGATGVAGGYLAGKSIGASASNLVLNTPSNVKNKVAEVRDTFGQGAYGAEYNKIKEIREYSKSKDVKKYYQKKYGDDWEREFKRGIELKKRYNFNDQSEVDKAIKLMNSGLNIDKTIDLMKFRKKASADYNRLTDENSRKGIEKDVSRLVGGDSIKVKEIMGHLDSIK